MPNARQILQEPVFTYKYQTKPVYRNHHTLRMRRRRRKLSLNLTTDELSESKDSHSDSELECGKSFGSRSRCDRGTGSQAYKRVYSQSSQSMAGGCGRQHSRLQCADVQRKNIDDTTPEELASYFDQLLYIPKPMSAMAEMMYTWLHSVTIQCLILFFKFLLHFYNNFHWIAFNIEQSVIVIAFGKVLYTEIIM